MALNIVTAETRKRLRRQAFAVKRARKAGDHLRFRVHSPSRPSGIGFAACLTPRMGIGFSAGGTFARPGLEGFRPAFLSSARTRFLSCQPAANEINLIAGARTVFILTGCAATISIGEM